MNKVESAICRIRQKLPGNEGFVTLGSGCVVRCQHLASKCGWKNPNIILTSNSVLNKEALASDRVFVADFISNEKKGLETFDLKLAAETCKEIARYELLSDSSAKTNGSNVNDEVFTALLTAVSVEHLDKRSFLKRMVKKNTLQTSRPIDCYGGDAKDYEEDLMCDGFLYCLVLCEKPSRHKNSNDFETQTFKCNYNRESEKFVLEHFGGGTCLQYVKDFNDEERPYGAVISSKKGEFVGVLDFNKDGIFPLFVPPVISVDEKVVNNNLDQSSTSEAEGDQESVERDSDLGEVDHKPVETEPHAAEESIAEEMPKGSNAEVGRILKPAAEEASTEQDPGSYPATYHAVSGAGEADSKVYLSEETGNSGNVAGKVGFSEEVKLETKTFSEETGIPEKGASETDIQSESPEIAAPTGTLEQDKGIEPESTDRVGISESQRELEEKSPVEELESPKEETPSSQDKDVQHDHLDNEMVEQQDMTVERIETYDRQVTQSESQSKADMRQPTIPQSQEETENVSKIDDEKVFDRMEKAVSQTMPDEVELPVENVPRQNNSESFAEASDIVLTSSAVGTSGNTEAKNLEPEEVELSLDRQAPEIDLDSIVETGTASGNKEPESSLGTESQAEVCPSSECRDVPTNTEEPKSQIEGVPFAAETQDEEPETSEYGNNLQASSEAGSKICSGTELDENSLDLQQVEPPRAEVTLSIGIGECTDSGTAKEGAVNETKEEFEIELISPTDTTGVEVKEVPHIELGSPTDPTEVEMSKVSDSEVGVPADPTEVEVCSEVPENELVAPPDKTVLEDNKELSRVECATPSEIELGAHVDTTELEESKGVPVSNLGQPSETALDAPLDLVAEDSKELPEIGHGASTEIEPCALTGMVTAQLEEDEKEPVIETGAPAEIELVAPEDSVDSKGVPEIKHKAPTEIEPCVPVDTAGLEVAPAITISEPLVIPAAEEEGKSILEEAIMEPKETKEIQYKKEIPATELDDGAVASFVEEDSKDHMDLSVDTIETEIKETAEIQSVPPIVIMADILVSEKVEGTTLLKTASGEEGNVLPAEEILADSQGLTYASNKQETKETEDTADTEIPKIQVDLVAPEVVAGAVDSDGQEDEREDTQTDGSSTEKIPCSELRNDFAMCVRSLSDMNVTIRRLDTDTLLSDVVTNDPVVSEELARHLDIEYRHGHVSCWRDVADLLAIPPSLYEHCLMYSKSSPTEDLFAFLAAAKPDTTMHDIKDVLRTMERLDVVQTVDKYLARSGLKDDIVAGTLVEKDEEYILGRIALKLDKSQPQNWRSLAAGLEIPRKVFRNFGSQQEHNSALLLLKYLPIFDPELSVAMLKDTLDEIDRSDVVQVLDAAGIPDNDQIKDILDDLELMDQVSDLLNEQGLVDGKTWRHLAKELGVPKEKRRIFEPADDRPSPTKLLLKSVESFDPEITVEELILALVATKRYDVLEALKKYFESEDIHKILEENNLLPPADDSTCSRLDAEGEGENTDGEQEGDDIEA